MMSAELARASDGRFALVESRLFPYISPNQERKDGATFTVMALILASMPRLGTSYSVQGGVGK